MEDRFRQAAREAEAARRRSDEAVRQAEQQKQQEAARKREDRDQYWAVASQHAHRASRSVTDIITQFGNVVGSGRFTEMDLRYEEYNRDYEVDHPESFGSNMEGSWTLPAYTSVTKAGLQSDFAGSLWSGSTNKINVLFGFRLYPELFDPTAYVWRGDSPDQRDELLAQLADRLMSFDDTHIYLPGATTYMPAFYASDPKRGTFHSSVQTFQYYLGQIDQNALLRDTREALAAGLERFLRQGS